MEKLEEKLFDWETGEEITYPCISINGPNERTATINASTYEERMLMWGFENKTDEFYTLDALNQYGNTKTIGQISQNVLREKFPNIFSSFFNGNFLN